MNPRESLLESTLPRSHEDHIAETGFYSINHNNLEHQFIPMFQAMKILDAKAAVDKEWKKLDARKAWPMDKMRSKKDVVQEQREKKKKVHFAALMGICH